MHQLAQLVSRLIRRPGRLFLVLWMALFACFAAWGLATPLFAGPDEAPHITWAYALDHFSSGGNYEVNGVALRSVRVPLSLGTSLNVQGCFDTNPSQPANCATPLPHNMELVPAATHFAQYPPLYYALVGLGTYVLPDTHMSWGARLIGWLINSLVLAVGLTSILVWSRNRWLLAGFAVALSAQELFLGAVVNPAGLEIATAISLWAAAMVLAFEHAQQPPKQLLRIVLGLAGLLALIRPISAVFVVVIGLVFLGIRGWRDPWRWLSSTPTGRRWGVTALLAGIVAVTWVATHKTFKVIPSTTLDRIHPGQSEFSLLKFVLTFEHGWFNETVGVFGWLDTWMPHPIYVAWEYGFFAVVLLALALAPWRLRLLLVGIATFTYLWPVLMVMSQIRHLGVVWQGRDDMPVLVGVWLLAFTIIGQSRRVTRLRQLSGVGALSLAWVTWNLGLFTVLRRYMVGLHGNKTFLWSGGPWHPPVPALLLWLVPLVISTAVFGALLSWVREETHEKLLHSPA